GSEVLPDYGGELDMRGHADGTTVTLRLRTPWDADDEVQQAVEASVAAIADALGGEPSSV
ncbi:MAG TPA: hypothetical protein PKB06_05615, partial [Actinotalea sp.]|nr:hypothetical protein [Actinotalea sp.]